jgi:hypothetical protein
MIWKMRLPMHEGFLSSLSQCVDPALNGRAPALTPPHRPPPASTDIDSRDFKMHKPDQAIKSVMSQLEKRGKGIILMHDFQHNTPEALPELVRQFKAGGYKVVHMVPCGQLTTIPKYDEMVSHQDKLSSNNTGPENSVVRTIGE